MNADINNGNYLSIGRVVITARANKHLMHGDIIAALNRHRVGDWGEVSKADLQANDNAFKYGGRILSEYTDTFGNKFWIITEADRSYTTILMPDDY